MRPRSTCPPRPRVLGGARRAPGRLSAPERELSESEWESLRGERSRELGGPPNRPSNIHPPRHSRPAPPGTEVRGCRGEGGFGGARGVSFAPHLRRKCRPGEREEDRDRDREPALEEELFSFMKTLRLPNLVGKPLPRARPAPVPPPRWGGGPRVDPPVPAPRWGGGCDNPEPAAGRGGCRAGTSQRFFLGLSATLSRFSLQGRGRGGGEMSSLLLTCVCVPPPFWGSLCGVGLTPAAARGSSRWCRRCRPAAAPAALLSAVSPSGPCPPPTRRR